jgi:hypothetical protein
LNFGTCPGIIDVMVNTAKFKRFATFTHNSAHDLILDHVLNSLDNAIPSEVPEIDDDSDTTVLFQKS